MTQFKFWRRSCDGPKALEQLWAGPSDESRRVFVETEPGDLVQTMELSWN